ncbi:Lp29 family lipoprotein [Leptospira sp. GIMC2001]|uniref:Lp29 family lipoprotein n=1 Tax=Leptospira sp. GIMC2001 TaxID=1513297 RepID=UPI00234A2BC9|nr:hypothetical protein [Leptospira sp. GIMC2001]WCL48816.1 hypothetical protein O4O04_16135 [Leptospira sp. GIMC2001]
MINIISNRNRTFAIAIIVIFASILLPGCNIHFIRELPPIDQSITINKKIATVGFYPFRYTTSVSGQTKTTTALLNYNHPTTKLVQIGKRLDEYPARGLNTRVPPDKVKAFVLDYLTKVKRSGAQEIEKLVEIKGEGDKATFHLKNRDVDYYILGIHGPPFDEDGKIGNLGRLLLTGHLFLFTLGTSPIWTTKAADTDIKIYDKDLNLVAERNYKNRYNLLAAWWGNSEEGSLNEESSSFKPKLYEPDLVDFYNELPAILASKK